MIGKFIPSSAGFVMNVTDGSTTFTDSDLSVTLDGVDVESVATSTDAGVTAITAQLAAPLVAGSTHKASVTFTDSGGSAVKLKKEFEVPPYTVIVPGLKADSSLKGDSGFLAYATQISLGQSDAASVHGGTAAGAMQQFLGQIIDPGSDEPFINEADSDADAAWTYVVQAVQVVNETDNVVVDEDGWPIEPIEIEETGKFKAETGQPDALLTGIETSWDNTQRDGYVNGYLALLDLPAGPSTIGVNAKHGYAASIAPDFGNSAGGQVGGAKKTFNIFVEEAGLYPFQVLFYESGAKASIEIYSIVNGVPALVNDADVEGSIKAYTIKGADLGGGVESIVSTGRATIVSVNPEPGTGARSTIVEVVLKDGSSSSVKQDTIKLTLNGEDVEASVSKDGDLITVSYDGIKVGSNSAVLSYGESNGSSNQIAWGFALPKFYVASGPAPAEPLGLLSVTEWHGVGNGNMGGYNHDKYPDSPDLETMAGYFEWPQSGDPDVPPVADVRNNYFWSIRGWFYPPETGEYRFWSATDDHNNLFLSTDESPANSRLIAQETGWHPIRAYQPMDDEATSDLIYLEAGNAYYIELTTSEGGGGDNAALVITMPEDGDPEVAGGDTPTLGKYFSPFLTAVENAVDLTITEQPSDASAQKNATAQFSIGLSHDVGQVQWKMNGNVVGQGTTYTTPELGDEHDGAKVQAIVIYNGSQLSNEVTLTVSADKTAPAVIASDGSRYMNSLSLTFSEDLDEASANEASNYKISGLSVDSAELNGRTVTLNTAEQSAGAVYKVAVSNIADPAGNEFNGDVTIAAYVEARGFLWWDFYDGIGGAHPMENLTESENYPDFPDSSQLMPWTNTRWATGFHNNAHENYGGRMSGWLVAPEDGEYRIWLRSDDHGQVWLSSDDDPENVELIAEQTGCCNAFTLDDGGLSGLVELEEGQRYYFEALLKEGGGGDWMNVGWTRPSDEELDAPPWDNGGISGQHFVNNIPAQDPNPADIYSQGTGAPASGGGGLLVREFQGIGGSYLGDLFTNAKWPNSPDLVTYSNHAEWPQNSSGDINDVPEGNVQDNYGMQLLGYVHPPETGEYQFFVAADDRTVLYISTDETPENKRLIAIEPEWNGVRAFASADRRVIVDGDTGRRNNGSAPVSLVAGKAYFIEAVTKEGGGGDNLAITWIRSGDDLPADGALPIAGEHLSPWIAPPAPVDNGDGTLSFDTHLAWEWWDGIGGAHPMENLTDNARYPDLPDGATWAPSWNTRAALAGGFDGNGRESYGGRMSGVLTAPESGTYRFFIASDDHGLLNISTDADPANAVRVAEQTGCCNSYTLDDGGLSGTVDLVAGNQYYMEGLLKEGGGGDWLSVAWRKPSEDIDSAPAGGQGDAGIPGKYFTGTIKVPGLPALSSSVGVSIGTSMDPKATVTLNVSNGATTLDAGSVAISVGGNALDSAVNEGTWTKNFGSVAQEGATYSITADTGAIDAGVEYAVSATFKDSAGETTTHEATFTIPIWEIYNLGTEAPGSAVGAISVREYWGVGGGSIAQLEGHATFPDAPTVEKDAGYFEWPQSGDINVKPEGNVMDNYGVQMIGFIHPPETGDYQFAIASDDNSQLWLSTDANPANRQLIAQETGWQPLRAYQAVGDEATSEFITLEAGKAYYIEALMNEGGGGDNLAVAWTTGDPIEADALPISGEYLSPWVTLEKVEIVDVSQPGDPVVPSSDNSPGGEQAHNAIDNDMSTKYLNFDGANDTASGLTITTTGGVVTGLGLTSANDAPDRDPATFVLSGSNDGGATFTEIASGDVPAFGARFERQEVSFANEAGYLTYQLSFPTTAGSSTCCMQIAEVELTGEAWEVYNLGTTAPGSAAGSISLREFDGIGGTSIGELLNHPSYPGNPTLETSIGYFEWPQSGDIAVNPEGNVKDNYGAQLIGFLHPAETGDYQFALAADDNAQLWLSTDENPANKQLIAQETGWQPVRGYQAVGDEATSEFIALEAGKAYYIEAIFNEGGGGDNIAVAWTTGDPVAAGAQPISGDYLSPWIAVDPLAEPTIVDFGDLSGDASYEFHFNAVKAGASTAIAGNNAFAFKLDQWNEQGIFGTTVFGVADNVFTPVEGKSVASVFDRDVHVVLVNDTAAGETRLYVDGDHVGVLDGNFELAGEAKVMGARIEANTDPMGEGSVMHKWAVYNSALGAAEIADLAAAVGAGGGDAPALSIVNNGDGTVTVTFEGKLQAAASVDGPWADVDEASPLTIDASEAMQYARAVNE